MPLRVELPEEHFAVQVFLNAIWPPYFVKTLEGLASGHGSSFDDAGCMLPGDLDPGMPSFEGVRCSCSDEEVTIDRAVFKRYLTQACEAYLKDHPADRARVEAALARFKP